MSSEIDVYVSYAHADGEVVKPLVDDLRARLRMYSGHKVALWLDQSNVAAGSSFPDELRDALARARTMLAVLSPSYLGSHWTKREYETFLLSDRPIFCVVLEEFRPDKDRVRELIGDRLYYAAPNLSSQKRDEQYHEFIARLANGIADVLRAPARVPPEVPQEPPPERPTQPAKGYVFLSYAEEDADFLAKLRAFFGERGYAYWEFETSDRDYQKRIDLELEGVISNAVATVSVLSEAWKASTWSLRELFFSQEIGKPVFLLKAKPLSPTLAIAGFPYIDFTKDSQQAFSRLARELNRAGL